MAQTILIKFLGDAKGLSGAVSDADTALGKFAQGAKAALEVVAAAATAVSGVLLKIGTDFNKVNDTLRAGTGETGVILDHLKNIVGELAKHMPNSLGDIATAVTILHQRTNLAGNDLQVMAQKMLELSRVTGSDLALTVRQATRLFDDWSVPTSKQTSLLDFLLKTTQQTGIGLNELINNADYFGAAFREMGFDLESTVVQIAKWNKEGVTMTTALSGMRQGIANLGRASFGATDNQKLLNEALVESGESLSESATRTVYLKDVLEKLNLAGKPIPEQFRALLEVMKNTKDPTDALRISLALFGVRAGVDMVRAVQEGRFNIDELAASIGNSTETTGKAADATMHWQQRLQILKNNAFLALQPVADRFVNGLADGIQRLTPKIVELGEKVEPTLKKIGVIMDEVFTWMRVNIPPIMSEISTWIEAHVVPALERLWGWIQEKLVPALQVLWASFKENILPILRDDIGPALSQLFDILSQYIVPILGEVVRIIIQHLLPAFFELVNWIWTNVLPIIGLLITSLVRFIGGIIDTTQAIWGFVTDVWRAFGEVRDFIGGVFGGFAETAKRVWDTVIGIFRGAMNVIIDAWNGLEITMPEVDTHIPGVGKVGGWTLGLPNLPRMATGSVVRRPTVAIVGDTPGDSEIVSPTKLMRQIVREESNGSGGGINIGTINMVTNAKPSDLTRELKWLQLSGGVSS